MKKIFVCIVNTIMSETMSATIFETTSQNNSVMSEITLPSHIIVKEGSPLPLTENVWKKSNYSLYKTRNPFIFLLSVRLGFKIHYYYVSEKRLSELVQIIGDCE